MGKKKGNKQELQKFSERMQLTLGNMNYGLQRLDLLIISISSGGIYTCLEMIKFLVEHNFCSYTVGTFKYPSILFIIAIVANLISQYTGYKSNEFDYLMCDEHIYCNGKEKDEVSQSQIDKLDKKSENYNKITNFLNLSSLILLILGLIFLVFFYSNIIFS